MNADPRAETLRAGPTTPSAAGPLAGVTPDRLFTRFTTAPTRFGKTSERRRFWRPRAVPLDADYPFSPYEVAPDGKRFLVPATQGQQLAQPHHQLAGPYDPETASAAGRAAVARLRKPAKK